MVMQKIANFFIMVRFHYHPYKQVNKFILSGCDEMVNMSDLDLDGFFCFVGSNPIIHIL